MKICDSICNRSWTTCLGTLALLLACHFAAAADAKAPQNTPNPQAAEEPWKRNREKAVRSLELLKQEFDRIDQEVRTKRQELDSLREHLGMSDGEIAAVQSNSPATDSIRIMETQVLESDLKRREAEALHRLLEKMSRKDLKRALPTASPDPVLTSLLQNEAAAEQKMVALLANHGEQHPEVRAAQKVMDKIKEQIEDRLDAIMIGIKIRSDAALMALERLRKEVEETKRSSMERSITIGPYFRAKRDLENREQIRDRLQLRLYQEEIDAALLEAR